MFPLRDDNPTLRTPIVTVLLILTNIAIWVYVQGMGFSETVLARSVCQLGAIPLEITATGGGYGGVDLGPDLPVCEFGGLTYGALVSSMFLHGSWLHLIANMWFLWLFGNNVEDSTGRVRFLAFYLMTGVIAALAHVAVTPSSPVPMVGASGAISAVMGAYLVLYPRIRIETLFVFVIFLRIIAVPAWFVLVLWFGLQMLAGYTDPGMTSAVAVWAHIGGFVSGVVLVKVFEDRGLVRERLAAARARTGLPRVAE